MLRHPGAISVMSRWQSAAVIAAPYCATILGEFGAEVLKIERPIGGDACRRYTFENTWEEVVRVSGNWALRMFRTKREYWGGTEGYRSRLRLWR
jgi:hypothetical protein